VERSLRDAITPEHTLRGGPIGERESREEIEIAPVAQRFVDGAVGVGTRGVRGRRITGGVRPTRVCPKSESGLVAYAAGG
jgi:hypothetical protein